MSYQSDQTGSSGLGWLAVLVIIVIFLLATCGRKEASNTDSNLVPAAPESLVVNDVAAAALEPPSPLDMSAVKRGYGQWRLVAKVKLADSSEVYSRNCYEALEKTFDWHQLDRCGGFDALATRWVDESTSSTDAELTYFQTETTATRYLAAATAHGLPADQADLRWATLEAVVKAVKLPSAAAPAITATETDSTTPALANEVQQATETGLDLEDANSGE